MTHDVIIANAMLVYLAGEAEGEATLGQLASRFSIHWKKALDLLWGISLAEIEGHSFPFDIVLPPRPGRESENEAPTTPESVVRFSQLADAHIPPLTVILPELISLLSLLDSVMAVTPTGASRDALSSLRSKLVASANKAGFASAMWEEPSLEGDESILALLNEAAQKEQWVTLSYRTPDKPAQQMEIFPVEIRSEQRPSLQAWGKTGVRTLRIDRIHAVTLGRTARRSEKAAARRAIAAETSWVPQGETVTLLVEAPGRWIADTLPGVRVREEGNLTTVIFESRSDSFLASLLVQLGTSVVSIKPTCVAQRMRAYFTKLAANVSPHSSSERTDMAL